MNQDYYIEKANKIKGFELKSYKNNVLTGWGYCLWCKKDSIQITCFDAETDQKVGLCTICLNLVEA